MPYISHLHYLGLFILLVLGGLGFPSPEDATLILCGVLISAGDLRVAPALLTVYAGMLTADFSLYSIGRKYGRRLVTLKRFQRLLPPQRLERLEEKFKKRGALLLLLGRHFPVIRAQLFLVSGIMRMPFWKFALTDAAAAVVTLTILVGLGWKGGNELPEIREYIRVVGHVVLIAAVAAGVAYLAYRYLTGKKKNLGG